MILDIIKHYSDFIEKYEILKFKIVGDAYSLICVIDLKNATNLTVRDYLF